MTSYSTRILSAGLTIALSLSAIAEDNNQNLQAAANAAKVSEEIIVIAAKAPDAEALQLAMRPTITDTQNMVLQDLAERLRTNLDTELKGQRDI